MLQGSFETLGLTEILDLLAAAAKTGGLHVVAGRDAGTVWIEDGACIAVEHDGARSPLADDTAVSVRLVQLGSAVVRHRDGAFRFVPGEKPPWRADTAVPLAEARVEIAAQLARWREVRKVVPSLDVTVELRDELAVEQLVLDRQRWRVVAAVGAGRGLRELAEEARDELTVCQVVADLVSAGAATVTALTLPGATPPAGRSALAEAPYGPGVDEPGPVSVGAPGSRAE